MQYLIPILLAVPIVGALACAVAANPRWAKTIALVFSLACVGIVVAMLRSFNWGSNEIQFAITLGEVPAINSFVRFGVDSISLWLVVLTVFLQPLAITASFQSIQERPREYYAWMLVLLSAMLGVFVARDMLVFYVFFELTLVPMFFIIGIWGGPQRRRAAGRFFLFTFAGSVFTLAAIIYVLLKYGGYRLAPEDWDISALLSLVQRGRRAGQSVGPVPPLSPEELKWIALGFLAGFAVKVPLFPVHTWLPLAHTEAPTAGSVILAGVLLKLGTYGLLRFVLPLGFAPGGHVMVGLVQFIGAICLIGIVYGALVAWVQQDIKKLVAYSSVSHLGFCVLGLAALNIEGVQGSILYMINHGLSTGALFLVVGMIYDRYHTRDINELSGLARKMPRLAFFFVLFTLSSIGLPGLNGFVSEFLTILGAFKSSYLGFGYGAIAALGIILGAVYMLHMTARVIWGPLKVPGGDSAHGEHGAAHEPHEPSEGELPTDIGAREIGLLVPIALAVVVLGVIPGMFLKTLDGPTRALVGGIRQEQSAAMPAVEQQDVATAVAGVVSGPGAEILTGK